MALGSRGGTTAEHLDRFYRPQAASYDRFRDRLLHGRAELLDRLPFLGAQTWVDFGGGTAFLLEQAGARLAALSSVVVVDLSEALLDVARTRAARHGWTNVRLVCGDVLTVDLPVGQADLVTFSYSLTMMPEWFAALDRAWRVLRPGGTIGVVDFFVSATHPPAGQVRHRSITRAAWPLWFGRDGVHLTPDHLRYLRWRFETCCLLERRGPLPFVPLARPPYYLFVGRRSDV
jgi:S-adenosylmethionine-diacylgycerolhomoserine-N-methlytransferase